MFYLFLHEIVVYRHFHIFNMASKMAAKGHVTIFLIIGLNNSFFYISNILLKFHSGMLNGSGDTQC